MTIINPEHLKMPDFSDPNTGFPYLKICKFWFDPEKDILIISHPYFKRWEETGADFKTNFLIWCKSKGVGLGDESYFDSLMYLEAQAEKLLTPS